MFKTRLIGSCVLALVFGLVISSGNALAAMRYAHHAADITTSFMLNTPLNFSNANGTGDINGATTYLDTGTVESGVNRVFQNTLFSNDGSGTITVYTSGFATTTAQVTQNADGSTTIQYQQTSNAGSNSFNGTLSGDQMTATYEQQAMGGTTVGDPATEYYGGTDISATFTTTVNWVTSDQLPSPPTNGEYQLTSDGGVSLFWTASDSSNVTGYHVYRMIFGVDNQPQLLGTTTNTSYTDESPSAIQNAQSLSGMMYTIYSVGSTGIENPTDVVIAVAENPMDIVNSIP